MKLLALYEGILQILKTKKLIMLVLIRYFMIQHILTLKVCLDKKNQLNQKYSLKSIANQSQFNQNRYSQILTKRSSESETIHFNRLLLEDHIN